MTEDDVTRGLTQTNILTGKPFEPVEHAVVHRVGDRHAADRRRTAPTSCGSSTTTTSASTTGTPTTASPPNPFAAPAAEPVFELHNLTADPEERHNLAGESTDELSRLQSVLGEQRDAKRLVPSLRNP